MVTVDPEEQADFDQELKALLQASADFFTFFFIDASER